MAQATLVGSRAASASLSISAAPRTVTYGRYVCFSGKLSSAGRGVPGRTVIIERKPVGSSAYSTLTTTKTRRSGMYYAPVVVPGTGAYRTRFAGDTAYGAAISGQLTVRVTGAVYGWSSPRIVKPRAWQSLWVQVVPNRRGRRVIFQRKVGRRWVTHAGRTLDRRSRAYVRVRPTRQGTYYWRVLYWGDPTYARAVSLPFTTVCRRSIPKSLRGWDGKGPSVRYPGASPSVISPDGDGVADATTVRFRTNEAGSVTSYVYTPGGSAVRKLSGWRSTKRGGTQTWTWDGKNNAGTVVADGCYIVRGYARDLVRNYGIPYPVETPVMVDTERGGWSPLRRISQGQFHALYAHEVGMGQGPAGELHVVWHESSKLLYKKLDRYGNTLVNTVVLPGPATSQSDRNYPTAAASPDGSATVFVRDYASPPEDAGVFAIRVDSAGRIDSPMEHVHAAQDRFIDTDVDGAGRVHVVTREGGTYRPAYALYSAAMRPLSGWAPLMSLSWNRITRTPSVRVAPDGTAHVAWFDARGFSGYGRYQVYYSRIGYGPGSTFDEVRSVDQLKVTNRAGGYAEDENDSNDGGLSHAPAVDLDGSGGAHISWTDGVNLYYAKIGANGAVSVAETTLVAGAGGGAYMSRQSRISGLAGGGADIVYKHTWSSAYASSHLAHVTVDGAGAAVAEPASITPGPLEPWDFCMERFGKDLRVVLIGEKSTVDRLYYLDQTKNAQAFDTSRPDLVIDDAHSTNDRKPKEGQSVHMTLQVSNCGWVTSTATNAEFSYEGTTFATVPVPALGVDGTTTIAADWVMPANFAHDPAMIRVKVDPGGALAETSENNNEVLHRVPVRLRPVGTAIYVSCTDETQDESRNYGIGVEHVDATITGTIKPEEGGGSLARQTSGGGSFWFSSVPPGTYTLTARAPGYLPALITTDVAVSRSTTDPYSVTYSPQPIQFWFNQWGQLTGVCTSDGATPLSSVKAEVVELGKSDLSSSGGTYTVTKLREGRYHATFTKTNYARVYRADVTVTAAGITTKDIVMPRTTKAYVDVTVTNDLGTPIPGAAVELRRSSDNGLVGSGLTNGSGQYFFEPTAGTTYYVKASRQYYVTEQTAGFSTTAGNVYEKGFALALDKSAVQSKTHQAAMISWVEHHKTLFGGEVWILWGNYWTKLGVLHGTVGPNHNVFGVDATVKGNPFYLSIQKYDVKIPVGGPAKLPLAIIIPELSDEYTNVRVDAVQLINARTGQVYWQDESQWYSQTATDRQQTKSWLFGGDGYSVDWSDAAVKMWVRVGKATGSVDTHWFEASPILSGWRNDYQTVTWFPSADKMYIDHVTFGYPRW